MVYRPGHLKTKADVLSRRRDYADEEGAEAPWSLLKPGQWVAGARIGDAERQWVVVDSAKIASTKVYTLPSTFEEKLKEAAGRDPEWVATAKAAKEGSDTVAPGFEESDGVLLYENR